MIHPPSLWLALLGTSLVSAQDPTVTQDALLAAKQRLQAALRQTAALQDVAFTATWGPDRKPKGDDALAVMFGNQGVGTVTGSWHADRRLWSFGGDCEDQLLAAGGRAIARDKDHEWCVRQGRFADGNPVAFAPDVALLLEQLAAMDLAVVQRSTGALDDRPVEIVTVALNGDQVAEAAWSGIVPDNLFASAMPFRFAMMGGAGQRAAPPKPDATVDLAIALDPATSLIQQIKLRSWVKEDGNNRFVFRAGGGAVQVVGNGNRNGGDGEAEEEDEDDAKKKAAAPMTYEDGLPMRPRKKTSVQDFTVRITEHGTKKAPALTEAQLRLLGRR